MKYVIWIGLSIAAILMLIATGLGTVLRIAVGNASFEKLFSILAGQ